MSSFEKFVSATAYISLCIFYLDQTTVHIILTIYKTLYFMTGSVYFIPAIKSFVHLLPTHVHSMQTLCLFSDWSPSYYQKASLYLIQTYNFGIYCLQSQFLFYDNSQKKFLSYGSSIAFDVMKASSFYLLHRIPFELTDGSDTVTYLRSLVCWLHCEQASIVIQCRTSPLKWDCKSEQKN